MSAEVLRLAAAKMRAQWTLNGMTAPGDSEARFYAALADWLDNSASHEVSGYALAVARAYLGEASDA